MKQNYKRLMYSRVTRSNYTVDDSGQAYIIAFNNDGSVTARRYPDSSLISGNVSCGRWQYVFIVYPVKSGSKYYGWIDRYTGMAIDVKVECKTIAELCIATETYPAIKMIREIHKQRKPVNDGGIVYAG